MKTAVATVHCSTQDLALVNPPVKILILVLDEHRAATWRHDMLVLLPHSVVLLVRIMEVEGFLLMGALAGHAAHSGSAAKVDELLSASNSGRSP